MSGIFSFGRAFRAVVVLATLALATSGCTFWGWGDNSFGQRGPGSGGQVQVGSSAAWTELSAGGDHTCGIRYPKTLWCWGSNHAGQVGDGTNVDKTGPVQVGTATDWTQVSAGGAHTCGIRTDNSLWCWGLDFYGEVGNGEPTNISVPSPVQVGTATDWTQVSAGGIHTCGIRSDNSLWCWGRNEAGRLGTGVVATGYNASPARVGTATDWTDVSAGGEHTCGIRTDNTMWCWPAGFTTDPTQIGTATDWKMVSTGDAHTCGIRANNSLWCWGANNRGQLGDGSNTPRPSAAQVGITTDWSAVSAGDAHTCGIRTDGTMWCWGDNALGQIDGAPSTMMLPNPVKVGTLNHWVSVSAGRNHTSALLMQP